MRKDVSIEEYRRRIANRMQSLERSEPPPRVMPHVLAEWGIQSVTDSSVKISPEACCCRPSTLTQLLSYIAEYSH
jgi:hypothetical protein